MENEVQTPDIPERVVVLFSGGRDSSLAACLLAQRGYYVELFSTFNGAVVNGDLAEYRVRELRGVFRDHISDRRVVPSFGLFRRVALANIEEDFATFRKNLIPLGDALATHTEAILHCIAYGVKTIASGYTKYESHFPEQTSVAIQSTRSFVEEYGLRYLTPVLNYTSEDAVKYALLELGVSTKSLEGTSLFADTYTIASPEVIQAYTSAKLAICREYLRERLACRELESDETSRLVHAPGDKFS